MKKIILLAILLILFLQLNIVLGQESEVLKINYSLAVEIALDNNLDLKLTDLSLEEAQTNYKRIKLVGEEEEIEEALENYEQAQLDYLNTKENLILDIEESYLEILKAKQANIAQKESLEARKQDYQLNEIRFSTGLISELTLKKSANSLLAAKQNYENNCQALITLYYRFKQLLGIDYLQEIELVEEIVLVYEPLAITFEQALVTAREKADRIINAQERLEDAKEAVRLADNDYTPKAELEKATRQLKQAEINLEKAENNLFLAIRTAYLNLRDREANIELRKVELDLVKIYYQVALAKFENGDISEDEYKQQKENLQVAENNYQDAILNYIKSRRQLLDTMGTPERLSIREGN